MGPGVKTIILLEMAILAGGGILNAYRQNPGGANGETGWELALLHSSNRVLIAVVILTTLLLSADEVGQGKAAALFGGLVSLSYVMGAIGWLGPAVQQAEGQLFSSGTAPVTVAPATQVAHP